jgi:hypothetical protein
MTFCLSAFAIAESDAGHLRDTLLVAIDRCRLLAPHKPVKDEMITSS